MTTKNQNPRMLPNDLQSERAVLSALLIDRRALDAVGLILVAGDFYAIKHQLIYQAILEVGSEQAEIDYLLVCDKLKTNGHLEKVGGLGYLAELTTEVVSAAQIVQHAGLVKQSSVRRQLLKLVRQSTEELFENASAETVAIQLQADIFRLLWGNESRAWKAARDVMNETLDFCQLMQSEENLRMLGIPSGLRDFDDRLGGFRRGSLSIFGGRPSMGKTSLGLLCALSAAAQGQVAAVVSLEMTTLQMGLRILAMRGLELGIARDLEAVRRGRRIAPSFWFPITNLASELSALSLYIDDSSLLSLPMLRAKCRQLKTQTGLDLLVVDYLQLLDLGPGNRRENLEEVSRGLKLLAKELDIAVIACSQLSRKCEERDDKRPIMADLRESGAIEQDADVIVMLYRDDVYDPNSEKRGIAELLIRKNRDGATGNVDVTWIDQNSTFVNLSRYEAPQGGTR